MYQKSIFVAVCRYLFTMSLFSSAAAPCHFSVSASISEDIIFISKPDFAIFACSSESNLTAFRGLLVVPCFYEAMNIILCRFIF